MSGLLHMFLTASLPKPPPGLLDWTLDKSRIGEWTGLPDTVLHFNAGLILMLVAAVVLRRRPWDWRCWLIVVALESANELYDVFQPFYPTDEGNWAAAWSDFWVTLLWPTIIMLSFGWIGRRVRHHEVEALPAE